MTSDFYNKVVEETNKYAALSQRKAGTVDNNWEDTNAEEIQAYIGILIYMGQCTVTHYTAGKQNKATVHNILSDRHSEEREVHMSRLIQE